MDFFFRENVCNFERRMRIPPRRSLTKSAAKNRLPVLLLIYLWMEEIDSGGQTNKCVDWAGGLVGGILRPLESSPNPAEFFFFFFTSFVSQQLRADLHGAALPELFRNFFFVAGSASNQTIDGDENVKANVCNHSMATRRFKESLNERDVCVCVCRCVDVCRDKRTLLHACCCTHAYLTARLKFKREVPNEQLLNVSLCVQAT